MYKFLKTSITCFHQDITEKSKMMPEVERHILWPELEVLIMRDDRDAASLDAT